MTAKLAASILSADFAHLADQVKLVEDFVDFIHIDVMDAHFVPPLTVGPVVVASLRPATGLPLHCHLQVERPLAMVEDFARAGADVVTCHVETLADPAGDVHAARACGVRVGLAVSPGTPVQEVFPHLEALDRVVVMSVMPGWAGQEFLEGALPKIEAAREEVERRGLSVDIEVDGGINEQSAGRCLAAGATVLAAASSIFRAPDPADAARSLAAVAGR